MINDQEEIRCSPLTSGRRAEFSHLDPTGSQDGSTDREQPVT